MMAFAYAPTRADPPEIYVRWTWVKEMAVPWDRVAIDDDDLPHLANLLGIKAQADELRSRTKAKGHATGNRTIGGG